MNSAQVKQQIKKSAQQIADEPLELLKNARRQVSENISQTQAINEKNENQPPKEETEYKKKVVEQDGRHLQALESELKDIRRQKLFNELINSKDYLFPEPHKKINAPNKRGVYIIYSPKGKVLHVGCTPKAKNGIAQRLRDHLNANSSFTNKYLKRNGSRLRSGYKYKYLVVSNPRLRAFLEAYAIGNLCPAHIGLGQV